MRHALLIATDEYTDPALHRLQAPAQDVRALAEVLADPRIGDYEVRDPLINRPVQDVRLAIEDLFADAGSQDAVVLYVAGHGRLGGERLYFTMTDTNTGRLRTTAVEDSFVKAAMEESHCKRVVLLLDCCHSGRFGRGLAPRGAQVGIEQRFAGQGHVTLAASGELQYAWEELRELEGLEPVATSVFTGALIDGLRTGAADRNEDGHVSVDELVEYMNLKTRHVQTPVRSGELQGDMFFAHNPRPVRRARRAAAPAEAAPRSLTSRLRQAAHKQGRGEYEEALADYEAAVALAPRSPEALAGRGWARLQLHRYLDARRDFDAALALDGEDTLALAGRGRVRALSYDLPGAFDDLDRALALDPDLPEAHVARGFAAMRPDARRLDEAAASFERALELQPDLPDALVGRALLAVHRGEPRQGLADCARVMKAHPEHPLACATSGMLQLAAGGNIGLDQLARAHDRAPASCEIGLMHAYALAGAGRLDEAAAEYDRQLEAGPDRFFPLMGRGMVALARRAFGDAVEAFTAALDAVPASGFALAHRGMARLELGDATAALDDLEAAMRCGPDVLGPGGVVLSRGRAFLALGRHDEARADFAAAARLQHPAAAAWRKSLDAAVARARPPRRGDERGRLARNVRLIDDSELEKGWYDAMRSEIRSRLTGTEQLLWLGRCALLGELTRSAALLVTSEQLVWCRETWLGAAAPGAVRWEDVPAVEPLPRGFKVVTAGGETHGFDRLGEGAKLRAGAARGPEQAVLLAHSLAATARDLAA